MYKTQSFKLQYAPILHSAHSGVFGTPFHFDPAPCSDFIRQVIPKLSGT